MQSNQPQQQGSFWRSRSGLALVGFFAIAAFYLITEHTAHLFGAFPYLLLLACPLMHLLHGGHGAHGDDTVSGAEQRQGPRDEQVGLR